MILDGPHRKGDLRRARAGAINIVPVSYTHLFKQVGTFHKCGYKFDRWYDMMWMEKHIGPHEHGQERVCPFPNIKNFK